MRLLLEVEAETRDRLIEKACSQGLDPDEVRLAQSLERTKSETHADIAALMDRMG
jgi:hypothetical protein